VRRTHPVPASGGWARTRIRQAVTKTNESTGVVAAATTTIPAATAAAACACERVAWCQRVRASKTSARVSKQAPKNSHKIFSECVMKCARDRTQRVDSL
jgi:hypothetical protein